MEDRFLIKVFLIKKKRVSHVEREYLPNIKVNFVLFSNKAVAKEKLKSLDVQLDKIKL